MFTTRRHRARVLNVVPLLAVLALAACDTATEPKDAPLNTGNALADYKAMETVLTSSGFASFQALGSRSPMSSAAAIGTISALSDLRSATGARAFAQNLFREATSSRMAVRAATEAVISPVHLGKTLVYNTATDQYEIDASRTGAPANGTRFVLYVVGANGRPDVSQEIGHADLLDEGANAGAAIVLRLVAVEHGTTLLDYRVRVEPQGTGGTIDVTGFLAGENNARLDFTIDVVGTNSGGQTLVDLDFTLNMALRNFQIAGTVQGIDDGHDGDGTVHLSVQHGDKTLQVDMVGNAGELDGSIRLNGNTFVTVTGPASEPILRNARGLPLTGPEVLLVLAIVDITDGVFDMVEHLLRPIDNLLVLGWIL